MKPKGPVWSDWASWSSDCSTTCGKGVRVRHRVCGKLTSEFGKCPGDKMEYEPCHGNNTTCPGKETTVDRKD